MLTSYPLTLFEPTTALLHENCSLSSLLMPVSIACFSFSSSSIGSLKALGLLSTPLSHTGSSLPVTDCTLTFRRAPKCTGEKVGRLLHSSASLSCRAPSQKWAPFSEQPQFISVTPKMVPASGRDPYNLGMEQPVLRLLFSRDCIS